MEAHPICRILPEMTPAEYAALAADVAAKGLVRAITTHEGMILDGRHRYRACLDSGVAPRFEVYEGSDPVGFVASSCTHRNLKTSQRALVAAGFLEYERAQAKARLSASGGDRRSGKENLPDPIKSAGQARDKAGARMGVSGRTVDVAADVLENAVPEIVEMVKAGNMALNEAVHVVSLNDGMQRKIAAMPKKQRQGEIESAHARKVAATLKHKRVEPESGPSTKFVAELLSGVERLAMRCAEQGLRDGQSIATRFLSEVDWSKDVVHMQFDRCAPILRALAIIQQSKIGST